MDEYHSVNRDRIGADTVGSLANSQIEMNSSVSIVSIGSDCYCVGTNNSFSKYSDISNNFVVTSFHANNISVSFGFESPNKTEAIKILRSV